MASLTDEVQNQPSLENGTENLIKYKKRKVSARRSFPPRCVTNTEPIDTDALLDVIVCIDDQTAQDKSAQSRVIVEAQSIDRVVIIQPDYVAATAAAAVSNDNIETDGLAAVDLGLPKSSEHNFGTTCGVFESKTAKTPNFVEDNASMNDFVGDIVATAIMDKFDNKITGTSLDSESLQGIGIDLVKKKKKLISRKDDDDEVKKASMDICMVTDMEQPDFDSIFRFPKGKSSRRKISASRNFPPNCGQNGPPPPLLEVSSSCLDYDEHVTIATLMANWPWISQKVTVGSVDRRKTELGVSKIGSIYRQTKHRVEKLGSDNIKTRSRSLVAKDSDELQQDPKKTSQKIGFIVNIPPFGSSSSSSSTQQTDARNKVKETLRLYQTICRKIMHGEEARSEKFERTKRIDLEAKKILDEKKIEFDTNRDRIGSVPGVEIGDEFQYRVELAIVGVHRLYQAGIDYIKKDDMVIATSIVASGVYADGWDNADVLIYSGQGGNVVGKKKEPEDQKLERGNLALSNSSKTKNPIRVVRGSKESKSKKVVITTYVYDGLYTVEKCWPETGPRGKMVYMFELRRIPGQPELAWKEVKNAKIGKLRRGVCALDISGGQEKLPICAVNLIDDDKPPPFTYIREMQYPNGFDFIPPQGCSCTTRCTDSRKCSCKPRNGEQLPYNRNGAIVEVKPIVYECGPACKCPPSCYNRVSQHGIKIQLEIFKTENRGWGVRSLSSIASGSFICEYAGELLNDKEAELRTGSDEYLFDIGKNNLVPSDGGGGGVVEVVDEGGGGCGGYTVDAAVFGNVGRFINHSCSPNLYAQNVLYDYDDKKMPHVMLFAADNIPQMQELTYDYNYSMNQVHDSNGNIKIKSCYCGALECRGRLY